MAEKRLVVLYAYDKGIDKKQEEARVNCKQNKQNYKQINSNNVRSLVSWSKLPSEKADRLLEFMYLSD